MRRLSWFTAAALVAILPGSLLAQTTTTTITIPQFSITVQSTTTGGTAVTTPPAGGTDTTTPPPPTNTGSSTPPPASVGTVNAAAKTLTLAAGIEPADALASMQPGWTMIVQPGVFKKTLTTGGTLDNMTIKCATVMKCTVDGGGGYGQGHRLAWGKACFHSYNNSLTVVGFHFINCGSPQSGNSYSNEAAVYLDIDDNKPHTLTVSQNGFDNNANALFSAGTTGIVVVDQNVFGYSAPNGMNGATIGTANGPAHDMYLAGDSAEVKGNFFYGSAAHNVKTRMNFTNVHDNPVMTMDGGRVVDLSNGGKLSFVNNGVWSRDDAIFPKRTIQSGLKPGVFGNSNLLAVGSENTNNGVPSGSITGSNFNLARAGSTIWVNAGSLTASGNKVNLFGSGALQVQGSLTGDLSAASALPGAPAHAPAPPNPPAWYAP